MTNLVSLNPIAHRHLKICSQTVENLGARLTSVPVMLSEFLKLVVQCPIVLTKNSETGQFLCVALFGFSDHENLFFNHGQWETLYTPLQIARQPFFVGRNDSNVDANNADDNNPKKDEYLICIDTDNDSVKNSENKSKNESLEALFDEQGQATPYLQRMQSLLAELLDGESKTQAFVDKLLAMKLVQPMRLEIKFINGDTHQVNGTYTINEDALNALPKESINALHELGYLSYIYTMIASMGQIYALVQRKNQRLAASDIGGLSSKTQCA